MPELPEVETCLRGIQPYLVDKVIREIVVRNSQLRWPVSKELTQMAGAKIQDITRRAKYLIIRSNQGDILVHLGMSGTLKICDTASVLHKHDHVDLLTEDGIILRYNDPRRFGCWLWAMRAERLPILARLGPEPWVRCGFSGSYLHKQTEAKRKAIKSLIMDNQVVVGVGNIYACEALFMAKIHPETPSCKLSLADCEALVAAIERVLLQAIEQGGTTLKDFRQPDGNLGYFAQVLQVYGRKGEPCYVCGTLVEARVIGQRNSFFCPLCQPELS